MSVELYTVNYCPYCKNAIKFLNDHNVEFTNHDITADEQLMFEKLGNMFGIPIDEVTVPQIIIDGKHIGGYSDMIQLYKSGQLSFDS